MKKNKLFYSITILCLLSMGLSSQNNFIANNTQQSLQDISVLINSNKIYETAQGSPYINDIFLPATIKGYSNAFFFARYNAYNGEMEIKIEDEIHALNNSTENLEVKFQQSNKVYELFYYIDSDKNSKRGFLAIVEKTEDYVLLKQESVKFFRGKKAVSGYEFSIPDRFQRLDDKYYLKIGENVFYLSTNKRELYRLFPDDAKKIKSYLKSEKISLKKESDLIKLAEFLANL